MNDSFPGSGEPVPTPEQAEMFLVEFERRRKRHRVAMACLGLWVIVSVIFFPSAAALFPGLAPYFPALGLPIAALGALAVAIFQTINFRCPQCNCSQARVPKARFCHNCGVRLKRDRQGR